MGLELTAALAQCHMLWYLHLCAAAGVIVTSYTDDVHGTMAEAEDGSGRFTEVVLRPRGPGFVSLVSGARQGGRAGYAARILP